MTNNEILRAVRYILNVSDEKLTEVLALAGDTSSVADVKAYLKKEEEDGYKECPHPVLARFLNGLVLHKRGRDESKPPQPIETPVTNNIVLKKLRVAFELRDEDLARLIEKAGLQVTKSELSAFFRKSDHRNYRPCGDQFLRGMLKGLAG
jgi:uncharacterized protein YehS (DUF1456 family)